MLSNNIFKVGIDKLLMEYGDKGFTMSKGRATQWYGFMKDYNDQSFIEAIDDCLSENSFVPSMADIIKNYKQSSKNILDGVKL